METDAATKESFLLVQNILFIFYSDVLPANSRGKNGLKAVGNDAIWLVFSQLNLVRTWDVLRCTNHINAKVKFWYDPMLEKKVFKMINKQNSEISAFCSLKKTV